MGWVARSPEQYDGVQVGDGHCVAFVQKASGAPLTKRWKRGAKVKDGEITKGTAIATFDDDDTYGNHTDGSSHAAIFVEQQANGLLVWDQWKKQPVHQRTIRFKGGADTANNDGDRYYVIED